MSRVQWLQTAALAILLVGLFSKVGTVELHAEEPRRAIVSMEMEMSGDYIVPTIHGENYYNKPPFYNWVLIGSAKIMGGFSEWSMRLPGIISFVLLAFCVYKATKKYINKEVALLAGFGFLTNPDILFYATNVSGEIDLFFSLLVFLQVFSFFHYLEKGETLKAFVFTYLLAAIGLLTKGLPALAFQGLTILSWLIITGQWKKLFSWKHAIGVIAFLLPIGTYLYAYSERDELAPFLINLFMESSQRTPLERSIGRTLSGLGEFPLNLLVLLIPFSFLFIPLSRKAANIKRTLRENRFLLFSLVFIALNIWIYWISAGTQKRYLYPFFPFIYVLLAYGYHQLFQLPRFKKWSDGMVAFFILGFISISSYLPFHSDFQFIRYLVSVAILMALIGIVVGWLYFKTENRIWLLFIVLGLLRLEYNLFAKPEIVANSPVRVYRESMQEITRQINEPITLLGERTMDINRAFGVVDTIYAHHHMPYAIPFYYTLYTDRVLRIQEYATANKTFIARELVPPNRPIDTLYQFKRKGHEPWVVFRLND
ncbi:MAG: hypothetical protein GY816_04400 [Cytophagales bacterium]|nr:hypothetical protein [Cytophagales bacterium]